MLTHGGLRAAVGAVVARLDLPVDAEVTDARLPPEIEASAYFIVAEALTNVVKHAKATRAAVTAAVDDGQAAHRGPRRRHRGSRPRTATGCWGSATAWPRSEDGC